MELTKPCLKMDNRALRPLKAFIEKYSPRQALVVCNEKVERLSSGIRIIPWRIFLTDLWAGRIIS